MMWSAFGNADLRPASENTNTAPRFHFLQCTKAIGAAIKCRILRRWHAAPSLILILVAGIVANPAIAQDLKIIPAETFMTSPGGVDMRTGRYAFSTTDLTLGRNDNSIALDRIMPDYTAQHANPFGNFSHNWDIWLVGSKVNLAVGGGGRPLLLLLDGEQQVL